MKLSKNNSEFNVIISRNEARLEIVSQTLSYTDWLWYSMESRMVVDFSPIRLIADAYKEEKKAHKHHDTNTN